MYIYGRRTAFPVHAAKGLIMSINNQEKPEKKPFRLDNFIAVITIIAMASFCLMVFADIKGINLGEFLGIGKKSDAAVNVNEVSKPAQQQTISASNSNNNSSSNSASVASQSTNKDEQNTNKIVLSGNYTVCIDPAYGGSAVGASANGLIEKDVTLAVGLELKNKLEQMGAKVILTRDSDKKVTNENRVAACNQGKADFLVSLRVNSADNTNVKGFEIWVNNKKPSNSVKGAELINKQLSSIQGSRSRGVKYGSVTDENENYYVNAKSSCASCVIQLGFITNKDDAAMIKNNKEAIADKIAQGLAEYFKEKK